jgi:hypothetical protein
MAGPNQRAWTKYQNVLLRLSKKIQAIYQQVDALGMEANRASEFLTDFDNKYGFEMGESGETAFLEAVGALEDLEEAVEYLPGQLDEVVSRLESAVGM